MTSPRREDDFAARMSDSIFGPDMTQNYQPNYLDGSSQLAPPNYPSNYPPDYPPNYPRRDQMLQTNYQQPPQFTVPPYYTSSDPNAFIPQETVQPTPPYTYGGMGSSSVASSQFTDTIPIGGTHSTGVTEIQEEAVPPSTSAPPKEPAGKKRERAPPEYNQPWARFYKITKDNKKIMKFLDCKVKGCHKHFEYKQANGMTSFKRHAETHERKGEEPSEDVEPREIQTLINADGTRTNPKFDEKKCLLNWPGTLPIRNNQ